MALRNSRDLVDKNRVCVHTREQKGLFSVNAMKRSIYVFRNFLIYCLSQKQTELNSSPLLSRFHPKERPSNLAARTALKFLLGVISLLDLNSKTCESRIHHVDRVSHAQVGHAIVKCTQHFVVFGIVAREKKAFSGVLGAGLPERLQPLQSFRLPLLRILFPFHWAELVIRVHEFLIQ